MPAIQQQLESFNEFVASRIKDAKTDATIDELFDVWRLQNPTPEEHAEDLAAVKAAIEDMENGDRGIPLADHIQEMKDRYNL